MNKKDILVENIIADLRKSISKKYAKLLLGEDKLANILDSVIEDVLPTNGTTRSSASNDSDSNIHTDAASDSGMLDRNGHSDRWRTVLENLCPKPEDIFAAFKLTRYAKLKIVVIGQDPYTSIDENGQLTAMGLAFSARQSTVPPSLKNIYLCLKQSNLIQSIPSTSDLTGWAKQGVLLLNKSLTANRLVGANSHSKLWKGYIDDVIEGLCSTYESPLIFMLWGNDAKKYAKIISKYDKHHYLEWCHPSPLANNKFIGKDDAGQRVYLGEHFINCTNFSVANSMLKSMGKREIRWSIMTNAQYEAGKEAYIKHRLPVDEVLYVATDGACKGNGTKAGKCSSSFVLYDKSLLNHDISRSSDIKPNQLIYYHKSEIPGIGTNNIGELYAIIYAMEHLIYNKGIYAKYKQVIIVTDSNYCLLALKYDDPELKKRKVLKNPAIVHKLIDNYELLKKTYAGKIELLHQRSHLKFSDIKGLDDKGKLAWLGNLAADKYATEITSSI